VIEPERAAELDGLTARLHAEGWADHVSVERLIRDWQQLAGEVSDYPLTIDDYTNDVTARDALDLVLKSDSDRTRQVIGRSVLEAGETFNASIVDDGGLAVSRYCVPQSSLSWMADFRDGVHAPIGPSAGRDQSKARMRAAMSPLPTGQADPVVVIVHAPGLLAAP
jgi:hypothetical protein